MSISILRESYSMIDKNNSNFKVEHEYGVGLGVPTSIRIQASTLKVMVKRLTYQT